MRRCPWCGYGWETDTVTCPNIREHDDWRLKVNPASEHVVRIELHRDSKLKSKDRYTEKLKPNQDAVLVEFIEKLSPT